MVSNKVQGSVLTRTASRYGVDSVEYAAAVDRHAAGVKKMRRENVLLTFLKVTIIAIDPLIILGLVAIIVLNLFLVISDKASNINIFWIIVTSLVLYLMLRGTVRLRAQKKTKNL